jgi:uncharacterized protein with HEPN domain
VSPSRRSARSDRDWLDDIDVCATLIARRVTDGKERFLEDLERQDSILRRLELIGEAVTGLSDELRRRNPDVPWRDLVGFRAKVIHHYFALDLERVWQVAVRDVPTLHAQIREIIVREGGRGAERPGPDPELGHSL